MFKKLLGGLAALLLLSISLFFVWIIAELFSSEVWPSVKKGSLNVETNSMILNRAWEGNELYWLLAAYLLVACLCAYGAVRFAKRVINT